MNQHQVTRDFEATLCEYTGAPYAIAVSSCTMALLLCCAYLRVGVVEIPKRTYVGVAQSIINAGGRVRFRDERWSGAYRLEPYPIVDAARRFTSGMYEPGTLMCLSFHISKILGVDQGGAILHDSASRDGELRRMRFDGRAEGVHPKDDQFTRGYHCYMSPNVAAQALWKLSTLPKHNEDLPNSDYSDLSQSELFRGS
jgi:dTDP-4-amino-4,6-dideoxygalactose transaminase